MALIPEQDLAKIVQQSLDLVVVLDPEDRTLAFINEFGANWLGLDLDQLLGKSPTDFLPELTDAELECIVDNLRTLESYEGSTLVTPVKRRIGTDHDFEFRLQLIELNDREYILATGRDIAERVAVTDSVHTMLAVAQEESKQDKTTSLLQRDAFLQVFRELVEQVGSHGLRLTLVVIDLKNLHEINDQFGQSIGDRILKNMGGLMHKCSKDADICARYSGRKLCILMPEQGQQDGLGVAEKVNQALAKVQFKEFPTLRIHSSIAVAELPEPGEPALLLDKVITRLREMRTPEPHEVHRLGLLSLRIS
ncbi:GGDEF domain-containing protein [Marinospirillum sp. MEB164]|uniref:GGDEF domain-containing protein n=1 Tax=Marinospirillum alkalitolerans TaxID=3123374 RepID=A0ABW8PYA6_9GAMM